jgi:hypothetical protein
MYLRHATEQQLEELLSYVQAQDGACVPASIQDVKEYMTGRFHPEEHVKKLSQFHPEAFCRLGDGSEPARLAEHWLKTAVGNKEMGDVIHSTFKELKKTVEQVAKDVKEKIDAYSSSPERAAEQKAQAIAKKLALDPNSKIPDEKVAEVATQLKTIVDTGDEALVCDLRDTLEQMRQMYPVPPGGRSRALPPALEKVYRQLCSTAQSFAYYQERGKNNRLELVRFSMSDFLSRMPLKQLEELHARLQETPKALDDQERKIMTTYEFE